MLIANSFFLTLLITILLTAFAIAVISLPFVIPYYFCLFWHFGSNLPKNYSFVKGFFKFYYQVLRFKRPTF